MAASTLLGKAELLAWAGEVTGIVPCDKYGDLKDGLIFLALARSLFPGAVDHAVVRLQRRGARDPTKNWSLLTACLRRHGVPTHLCSREAVERGHTRHCFNLLVLFYFLSRLSRGERFAVDFAQPVDPQLAAFLQSPESVAAVGRLAEAAEHTRRRDGHASQAATFAAEEGAGLPPPSITRLSSPPSAASASPPQLRSSGVAARAATGTERGVGCLGWGAAALPRASRHVSICEALDSSSSSSAAGEGLHTAHGPARAHDEWRRSRTPPHPDAFTFSSSPSAAASSSLAQALVPAPVEEDHLSTENRLLREELQHVKAVSQLLLTQQRGAEAAAEMRAAANLHDELAKAKLQHLHEVRQLQLMTATARVGELGHAPALSSLSQCAPRAQLQQQQWAAALQRRAETAEATAVQLYRELHESTEVYDATVQQLRGVLNSIADIAAAARPSAATPSSAPPTTDYTGTAAYEDAVAAAMMAQLQPVPSTLRAAFYAQLQTLLLTLRSLRSANARLRSDAALRGGAVPAEDEGNGPISPAPRGAVARGTPKRALLTAAVAEARDACEGAGPALQQAVRRLAHLAESLARDCEAALLERDAWEARCAAAEGTATPHARSSDPRHDGSSSASTDAAAARAPASDRLAQDRCARAEQALRASQRLCSRVEEVLRTSFSSPDTHDMRWASDALTEALQAFAARQGPNPAMEGALAEQAETIAALRLDVRQQRDARETLEGRLRDAERQRASLRHACAALQAQVRVAEEKLAAQRVGVQANAASLHAARVAKAATPARTPSAPASKRGPTSCDGAGALAVRWDAPHGAHTTPVRGTLPTAYTSPRPPGALLSPDASDEEQNGRRGSDASNTGGDGRRALPLRELHTRPQRLEQRPLHLSPLTTSLSPVSSASSTGTAAAAAEAPWTPHAAPRAHQPRNGGPAAPSSHAVQEPSLLLSAAELERRKQEILRRYDVV